MSAQTSAARARENQARIFGLLKEYPEGATAEALGERSGMHRTTCTAHLYSLKGQGLVQEKPDPTDGRKSPLWSLAGTVTR